MAVFNFDANSAGAPALTGQAGSLIAVLDWLLVTQMSWTKDYTGTNLAAYRQPVGTANRMYLRIDDTGGQNARAVGYEAMTAVSTGTGPFPTAAQLSGGLWVYKSNAATGDSRYWKFWSDGKIFTLLIGYTHQPPVPNTANLFQGLTFGDFKSYKSGDQYNVMIMANIVTSATTTGVCHGLASTIWSTTTNGIFVARSHLQTGSSIAVAKFFDNSTLGGSSPGAGTHPWPSPIDNGILVGRLYIGEVGQGRRGHIPGMWTHAHPVASLQSGDTIVGAGDLAGRTFDWFHIVTTASLLMETSDTWDD